MTDSAATPTGLALRAATALSLLAALGAVVMAVAHLGIDVPLLPTMGLGRPVPPAAAAFSAGALVFALTAWGLWRRARWAWALGLVAFALALQGSAMPYRGTGSAVGIATSVLAISLLLLPATRRALRS